MAFVSVTRLRLRSLRHLPAFAIGTLASSWEAARAAGFRAGYVATQGPRCFWTVTLWDDVEAMRRWRASGAHARAMPRLAGWCDEAALAHWEAGDDALPEPGTARARLAAEGRLSRVRHPSPAHAAGRLDSSEVPLRPGPRIRARR